MEYITSRQNHRVKEIAALSADAGLRRERGLCVIHGPKLCGQVALYGCRSKSVWIEQAYYNSNKNDLARMMKAAEQVYIMTGQVCQKLSPQSTPQGVLAVVGIPEEAGQDAVMCLRRVVALCGVQDPANVGAVMRTAAAFGFEGVLYDGQCADPFSPKALRASMGAVFELKRRCSENLIDDIHRLQAAGHVVAALVPSKRAADLADTAFAEKMTLLVGSEGGGLPPEVAKACDLEMTIPMTGEIESLNAAVAASIAMWRFRP